jgi:hypothetical protein
VTFDIGLLLIISRSLGSIIKLIPSLGTAVYVHGTPDKQSASYYNHIFDPFRALRALNFYIFKKDASKR